MSLFRKKTANKGAVGVQINADGVSLTHVKLSDSFGADDARPHVVASEWLSESDVGRQQKALADRVEALGLRRKDCHLVLGRDDYNLLLVEAPSVPESELREALRWRIRDLIDFPVESAVLDAFMLPEDRGRAGKRMAYVAVAHRERIQERIAQAADARLDLKTIDIPELSLRNIVYRLCETERGVALVRLGQGAGSLHIVRGADLHLARRFNVPYEGGLLEDLPEDVLVLEVQRSLDYFERQMRQPPPGQIVLVGENLTPDKITDSLSDSLPMDLSALDLESLVTLGEKAQPHTLPLCLEAIGAAMRLMEGEAD
ncbi:MSHA biogenesis protein MshI [Marinimicrobium locisalis]|uniref:MSHA biogenesis protein MshI n=1 Tax=Marinimicrobium locisalis TaxID=546022 RepID=UPI00322186B0